MNKLNNFINRKWSNIEFDRFLLIIFLLLAGLMRMTHPAKELIHSCQWFLSTVQIVGLILGIIYSFSKACQAEKLYLLILGFIGLFGLDIILSLHFSEFNETIKTGFYLYIITIPWYLRTTKDLINFHLGSFLAVLFLYIINPNVSEIELDFVLVIFLINVSTFFIVGNQLQKTSQLSEKGSQYGKVLERLNDGILQLDEHGTIVMVNQKFCKIIGYKQSELVGKMNISSMVSKENRRVLVKHLKDRKEEKGGTYEMKLTHKNGEPIWLFLSITTQFDQSGNLKGSIAIVSDITKKKQAEEELKEYSTNLQNSNLALANANNELEQFTQIAATDLKAPLASIKQTIKDIKCSCDAGDYEKGASMISRLMDGSKRMRELLNALSQYARSSSRDLETQKVNVEDVINKLLTFSWINTPSNVHLGTFPLIDCNLWQVERLFYHLIDNALKFTEENEPLSISITAEEDLKSNMAKFCIADNGLGISKEYYEHIFLIFQKGPYQDKSGMGLGLPICKKIVENHKGTIHLESELGKGTKVYFTLPMYKKVEEEPLLS